MCSLLSKSLGLADVEVDRVSDGSGCSSILKSPFRYWRKWACQVFTANLPYGRNARQGFGFTLKPSVYTTKRSVLSSYHAVTSSWESFSLHKPLCSVEYNSAAEMSASGTYRNTPKGRPQGSFTDSPSGIPKPKLESHPSETTSSLSASRAKQSKRDEVIAELCTSTRTG